MEFHGGFRGAILLLSGATVMCLPCPRLIRVLRTTLDYRYVHCPSTVAVKTSLRIFFRNRPPVHRNSTVLSCTSKVCRVFSERNDPISRWKSGKKAAVLSILSLFYSFFPLLVPNFFRIGRNYWIRSRRNNERSSNRGENIGGRKSKSKRVGSRYDGGGPRDGNTLTSASCGAASFRVPPRNIIGCYL